MKRKPTKSDLKKVDATQDEDIDYEGIPALDPDFLRNINVTASPGKRSISLRVDTDVLEWMKAQGKGYQSRINAILRAYYEAHRKGA